MDSFFKICCVLMVAAVLCLVLNQTNKDYSILLTIFACCFALVSALRYLEPVLQFLKTLEEAGNFDLNVLGILLRVIGISIVGETTSLVCCDAGNSSIGKAVQVITAAAIFRNALPLFEALLRLIQEILGNL